MAASFDIRFSVASAPHAPNFQTPILDFSIVFPSYVSPFIIHPPMPTPMDPAFYRGSNSTPSGLGNLTPDDVRGLKTPLT